MRAGHSMNYLPADFRCLQLLSIELLMTTVATLSIDPTDTATSTPDEVSTPSTNGTTTGNRVATLELLLLPLLCFIGLVGNTLVCVAIATDRRLQNVTNYFLFSLALADLLVCCIVMPVSIMVQVSEGRWQYNFATCLLYAYADVFLCSASIVHMSIISLDRYLGISQPFKIRNKSKTAIVLKITAVWLITIVISSPLALAALDNAENVLFIERGSGIKVCGVNNRAFKIYGSTLAFLIPFCIMAITYVRTTSLLNKQAAILSQNGNQKANGLRRAAPPRKASQCVRRGSGTATTTAKTSTSSYPAGGYQSISRDQKPNGDVDGMKHSNVKRLRSRTSSYLNFFVSRVNKHNFLMNNQELQSEHKATRVLALVFVCFFICWTPFFAANLIAGFCGDNPYVGCGNVTEMINSNMSTVFLWLGYVSSTINPLIYTVFNKRFRKAFIRILRGQCFHVRADFSSGYWSRTHTIMPDTYTYSNYDRAFSRDETIRTSSVTAMPEVNGHVVGGGGGIVQNGNGSSFASPNGGRTVAFANKRCSSNDWSPTSCHTILSIVRKESSTSRPASIRHRKFPPASRSALFSRHNTEDNDEEDEFPEEDSELAGDTTTTVEDSKSPEMESSPEKESSEEPQLALETTPILGSRSNMRRSHTNSILDAPMRMIATRDLIIANPIDHYFLKKGTPKRNGHIARSVNSESDFRKCLLHSPPCTAAEDLMMRSQPAGEHDGPPCLTLVASTKAGHVYKETFL